MLKQEWMITIQSTYRPANVNSVTKTTLRQIDRCVEFAKERTKLQYGVVKGVVLKV
jgi:hypothetical protein